MAINETNYKTTFTQMLNSSSVTFTVTILNSWKTTMSFNYNRDSYDYIAVNNNHHLNSTLRKYITDTQDDKYGSIEAQNDNLITDIDKKRLFCVKVCQDSVKCLNALLISQGRHILDYAVYFRERLNTDTYVNFIHKQVCNFIVHEDFISNSTFTLVSWNN